MPPTFSSPDLPLRNVVEVLRACGLELEPPAPTTTTVLDTFDGRLHEAGLRLERVQGVEGADASLILHADDGSPEATLAWSATPAWPDDLPSGPFRSRLAAVTEERALVPLLHVGSSRRSARKLDGRGKTVVTVDIHEDVRVLGAEDRAIDAAWFADIRPGIGYDDSAKTVVDQLRALDAQRVDAPAITAIATAAGATIAGHDSSPTVPLTAGTDAFDAFRQVLRNLASTIEANLPGTIDDIDPEFLHEFRVAVRRTRSVLSQSKGVLPVDVRARYREGFGWLGTVTGPPRDLDVYLLGWTSYVEPLSDFDVGALERVRQELEVRRGVAHRELSSALRSDTAAELLTGWREWLEAPIDRTNAPAAIGPVVASRIAKAQDKVLRDGRAITAYSEAERLHDLRKDAKKLRYLLECFGGLFPTKPRKAFVGQLKVLQDNLGDHQDAEVHLEQLRELARDLHRRDDVDSDVLLAMGRLSDHLDRRRRKERLEFTERFTAYDRKENRSALRDLLEGIRRG